MIGQTISHYRITGQLGSGGWGGLRGWIWIWPAGCAEVSPPQLSRDQNALDRFLFEARTASALNHPNICTIYAVEKVRSKAKQQSFIAMELLEGETLTGDWAPAHCRSIACWNGASSLPMRSTPRMRKGSSIAISSRQIYLSHSAGR